MVDSSKMAPKVRPATAVPLPRHVEDGVRQLDMPVGMPVVTAVLYGGSDATRGEARVEALELRYYEARTAADASWRAVRAQGGPSGVNGTEMTRVYMSRAKAAHRLGLAWKRLSARMLASK